MDLHGVDVEVIPFGWKFLHVADELQKELVVPQQDPVCHEDLGTVRVAEAFGRVNSAPVYAKCCKL